ncbi:carbon storage regulator CsrA [Fuchsiella alkaliacetigena]|uniref:carbon storage regulator CsrA n=1 Tax=Fuchsiella alkaliacetigena TaxID=957042 RepID=UPI00200A264D|nr:carbon storage regulator CsrA [Fuchsiella alkaliacetigena]MCK8824176.1 carbon storage regulator CsrA [Fuchsiella alkaliacetigena]
MLILSRKQEESIIIDDEIEIKVLELDNGRVQLGIRAPESVAIHREEIYKEIQAENKEALKVSGNLVADLADKLKGSK